ncbi:SGNH/GDSL hydrolase family protein [Kribbella ginsengisoli]|uniref:Fibronectin type-III domain-containing protein n=1 Tax=Kribbella ginsengisoli TaxID=363865 RepID=A0ABP6XGL9_9ACTN
MNLSRCTTILAATLLVAVGIDLPTTAPATATRSSTPPPATAATPTAGQRAAVGSAEGEPEVAVGIAVDADQRTYRLRITPRRSVPAADVTLRIFSGDKIVFTRKTGLGALTAGHAITKLLRAGAPPSPTFTVTAEITNSQSAVAGGASVVAGKVRTTLLTAATSELLEQTKIEYAVRRGWLTKPAGDEQLAAIRRARGKSTPGKVAQTAAAGITVSGTAKYTDGRGVQLPVRNAPIQLWLGSALRGTTRSSSTGAYSISLSTATTGTYSVRMVADMGNGGVTYPDNRQYVAVGPSKSLSDGMSWTGANVLSDRDSDTGHAFAALDALKTMSDYYLSKKPGGWEAGLIIRYPSGDDRSYTSGLDNTIYIGGGNVRCGTRWCEEDALDWDVIAHEVGHVVAHRADMDSSPAFGHYVCEDAWTAGVSKPDAARLAWSEGWASFWGQVALHDVAKPAGIAPDIGDGRYDDKSWPPNSAGGSFSYSMEDGGAAYCGSVGLPKPQGETSEMAVQAVLWDLWDSPVDGESATWAATRIYSTLWSAKPKTLTPALQALLAGASSTERELAASALQLSGLTPLITSHTSGPASASTAPEFRWAPGGAAGHLYDEFSLVIRHVGQTAALANIYLGNKTKFHPADEDWQLWAAGGPLAIEVEGGDSDAPATGPFTSPPVKLTFSTTVTKVMVVGDSISQGHEGDYTWRYRLANHLRQEVDFVGPWSGTTNLPATLPDGWPDVPVPPAYEGSYRPGISFDSEHYARWGRQLAEAKDNIRATVAAQNPKYILLELGFNDLGWGISDPNGLWTNLQTFIREARAARPDLNFLVANVTQRTPLGSNPGLPAAISSYNSILANSLSTLSTAGSTVALVDIDGPMGVADTYDGLHPNGVGEYKIAKVFATVLSSRFGLGGAFPAIPATVTDLTPAAPTGVQAVATDAGITISWNHSFGVSGYWLYQRNVTVDGAWERSAIQIPADTWKITWVFRSHTYEFKVAAAHGDYESGPSQTASAVANPKTANGPNVTKVLPGSNFVDLTWTRPTGDYSETVSSFIVYAVDENVPGAWLTAYKTPATNYRITNLIPGHRYNLAVASVNYYGDGLPNGAMPVVPGAGTPGVPANFTATIPADNVYAATMSWSAVSGAAGYIVQYRNWVRNEPYHDLFFPVVGRTTERVDMLYPDGAAAHTFCVKAFNGTLSSAWSNCVTPANPAPLVPQQPSVLSRQQQSPVPVRQLPTYPRQLPSPRWDSLRLQTVRLPSGGESAGLGR